MEILVDHLFRHEKLLPQVAGWIYNEFWRDRPGYSVETFVGLLRLAVDPDHIPLSLLVFADGQPAGTVNFVQCDSEKRPDLFPWLAALIVLPEFRNRGIGSTLVRCLLREAARLGYHELFLGTDIPVYYTRLGATVHDQITETFCVMRFSLASEKHSAARGRKLPETFHV